MLGGLRRRCGRGSGPPLPGRGLGRLSPFSVFCSGPQEQAPWCSDPKYPGLSIRCVLSKRYRSELLIGKCYYVCFCMPACCTTSMQALPPLAIVELSRGVRSSVQAHDGDNMLAAHDSESALAAQRHAEAMEALQLQFPSANAATLTDFYAAASGSLDEARQVGRCPSVLQLYACSRRGSTVQAARGMSRMNSSG